MRASYRWRVLGWVDFNELCPNGHQCAEFTICIFSKAMIRFFHFWFGVFSIFEKANLLQKIYVKFTVAKSLVMGYLKNIGSGGYEFEARFRKDYQHPFYAFLTTNKERNKGWIRNILPDDIKSNKKYLKKMKEWCLSTFTTYSMVFRKNMVN